MRSIVTDQVVWSVGRSVTLVSPAKTAEPIEMPFGLWAGMGPRNHVLVGSPEMLRDVAMATMGSAWRIRLNRPCAAAMRPYVKLFWPLVLIMSVLWRHEMSILGDLFIKLKCVDVIFCFRTHTLWFVRSCLRFGTSGWLYERVISAIVALYCLWSPYVIAVSYTHLTLPTNREV